MEDSNSDSDVVDLNSDDEDSVFILDSVAQNLNSVLDLEEVNSTTTLI